MRRPLALIVLVFVVACSISGAPCRAFAQEKSDGRAILVILSPHVFSGDVKVQKRAEILCDRLAQRLEKTPGIAVVNRTEIGKVLAEHRLEPAVKAVFSYDAMVRITVSQAGRSKKLTLTVLDLSMGNIIDTRTYSWPGASVTKMAALCAGAARKATEGPKERVKARLLNVEVVDKVARLEPLARKLRYTFEQSLLGLAGKRGASAILYTFDVKSGKITLLRRLTKIPARSRPWENNLQTTKHIWRHGKQVMGLYRYGIVEDVLSDRPKSRLWPEATPQGWPRSVMPNGRPFTHQPRGLAVIGERFFVMCYGGLFEMDPAGKTVRSWSLNCYLDWWTYRPAPHLRFAPYGPLGRFDVPGEMPGLTPNDGRSSSGLVGASESHLFIGHTRPEGLVCYDPEKDTWYGPVKMQDDASVYNGFGGKGGIWFQHKKDLVYVATADVIRAAKRAGKVMTSEECRKHREALFDAAPPLARGKFAFLRHRFKEAIRIFEDLLKKEPENIDALLLMGLIHDHNALNDRETAFGYYERAAKVSHDHSGAFAGLQLKFGSHLHAQEWAEALKVGRDMVSRFNITPSLRRKIDQMNKHLAGKVAE